MNGLHTTSGMLMVQMTSSSDSPSPEMVGSKKNSLVWLYVTSAFSSENSMNSFVRRSL